VKLKNLKSLSKALKSRPVRSHLFKMVSRTIRFLENLWWIWICPSFS